MLLVIVALGPLLFSGTNAIPLNCALAGATNDTSLCIPSSPSANLTSPSLVHGRFVSLFRTGMERITKVDVPKTTLHFGPKNITRANAKVTANPDPRVPFRINEIKDLTLYADRDFPDVGDLQCQCDPLDPDPKDVSIYERTEPERKQDRWEWSTFLDHLIPIDEAFDRANVVAKSGGMSLLDLISLTDYSPGTLPHRTQPYWLCDVVDMRGNIRGHIFVGALTGEVYPEFRVTSLTLPGNFTATE